VLTEAQNARGARARSRSHWRSQRVILFYAKTLVKGPGVLMRPIWSETWLDPRANPTESRCGATLVAVAAGAVVVSMSAPPTPRCRL
jgi:hypothetical protein